MDRRGISGFGTKSRRKNSRSSGSPLRDRKVTRTRSSGSSGSATNISSVSSEGSFDTTGLSVNKTLTLLRSQAANRSCADCRSALIDPSTEYASLYLSDFSEREDAAWQRRNVGILLQDFQLTHRLFAPEIQNQNGVGFSASSNSFGEKKRRKTWNDGAFSANRHFGGHGVLICDRCAEAHRQLGIGCKVARIMDSTSWTMDEANFIVNYGGNAKCGKIYEAYIPEKWVERRPVHSSSLSTRLLFCRAKYEALAFCLPQPGPLAEESWRRVIQAREKRHHRTLGSAYLKSIYALSLGQNENRHGLRTRKKKKDGLPNRLMDYFCVVTSSMQLISKKRGRRKIGRKFDYSKLSSPEALEFWPHLSDCYPPPNTHGEMGYQDHISSFVMPGGCHPTSHPKPPSFSTFVLTMSDGAFVYGGALTIYDNHVDVNEIRDAIRGSGYDGDLPAFLVDNQDHTDNHSDVYFFPKCLVVLSHYAFFNLFRSVLLELYQISLTGSPLPIERYISNFISEIPLPPQGKVKVVFSFSAHKSFIIERPPINDLPMTDFSFRPLFASLSVSNIIVLLGYLLQEYKIVLLSKHYSMLTPVAEALLSAIFPFRWVGLYIPVAPLNMMEILEAPIPYIIGMSSEYFQHVEVRHRPKDAILVDLDRDVIHIGDSSLPEIPERDAEKLSNSLEESGGSVYVIPNSGIKGCIMAGSNKSLLVENQRRPRYAQMITMKGLEAESFFRDDLFSVTDLAYGVKQHTENGLRSSSTSEDEGAREGRKQVRSFAVSPLKKPRFGRSKRTYILSRSKSAMGQGHLLDVTEIEGFSVKSIRNSFLRFIVSTFLGYQDSLLQNPGRDLFDEAKFVEEAGSRGKSKEFLTKVLESQLFQRFLEERRENKDLPEIRFFDESIVAKKNRSKHATLTSGGRKPTPFLDDQSTWKVTTSYTPPTPNNFGLDDTETIYRYGTFPVMDVSRFGRIRHPVRWEQYTSLDSKRYSKGFNSARKKIQKEAFKNASKSFRVLRKSNTASAKRSARDLESSLAALSIISPQSNQTFSSENTGERVTMPTKTTSVAFTTLSTADTIMMEARRKQSILLNLLIEIQSLIRGYLVRNTLKIKFESNIECCDLRSWASSNICDSKNRHHVLARKAVVIQSYFRMIITRKRTHHLLVTIISVQTNLRGFLARQKWKRLKNSANVVAKRRKGRRARLIFYELKRLVITLQSRVRGVVVRLRVMNLFEEKMTAWKSQIFSLWKHFHVSLIYRTKVWSEMSGSYSFASLRLAESEITRLWKLGGVSDSSLVMDNQSDTTTESKVPGITIGLNRHIKEVSSRIKEHELLSPNMECAMSKEDAERLQVYERLSTSVSEHHLSALYQTFDISFDESMKKFTLSQKLWVNLEHADKYVSSIMVIFPELKNALGIKCVKPSPKGKRRFPKAFKGVVGSIESDIWEEISVQGKTKLHFQEVAMLFITKVPELMTKLDFNRDSETAEAADSFFRAAMMVHGLETITDTKRFVIMKYLDVEKNQNTNE